MVAPVRPHNKKFGRIIVLACLGVSVTMMTALMGSSLSGNAVLTAYSCFAISIPTMVARILHQELSALRGTQPNSKRMFVTTVVGIFATIGGMGSVFCAINPGIGGLFIRASCIMVLVVAQVDEKMKKLDTGRTTNIEA